MDTVKYSDLDRARKFHPPADISENKESTRAHN